MLKREFGAEAERFLIDYGVEVRSANKVDELKNGGADRVIAFQILHKQGIKRLKALIAEFGIDFTIHSRK